MKSFYQKGAPAARMSVSEKILQTIIFFFALLNLFPIYWLFSNTFKYSYEVSKMPPDWFPKSFNLVHYKEIFTTTSVVSWIGNSLFVAIVGTLLVVLFSSMASYAFSKLTFTGSKFLYVIFIGTLMIPKESYIVPLFLEMRSFSMINTHAGMVLPSVALPFGVFMLKSFFDSIPNAVRESAKIDGANEMRIFMSIILPMAKAGLGALFILMFVRIWNDYLWQLLIGQRDQMKTLMVGVASMMEEERPDLSRKLTGAAISALPLLIVFISFQKYFTRGITIGAVKE